MVKLDGIYKPHPKQREFMEDDRPRVLWGGGYSGRVEIKMISGTIKRLVRDKGFGFIEADGDNRDDIFFHQSALPRGEFDRLQEGQRVEFVMGKGPKGPRADTINLL